MEKVKILLLGGGSGRRESERRPISAWRPGPTSNQSDAESLFNPAD
jgi:hypothetical protein